MSVVKNILVVGATGRLGSAILPQLTAAFTVSILTREGSSTSTSTTSLPNIKQILTANYTSPSSLQNAITLAAPDAIVSLVGHDGLSTQLAVIDAAVEAGVRRFLPSEYGSDTFNTKTKNLAFLKGKVDARELLQKYASEGRIEWTAVIGGPFLDWGIKTGFLGINLSTKSATIYDRGAHNVSFTTLSDYGQAIVGALHHPVETRNKPLYIHTVCVTQRDLLAAVEKATGSTFEVKDVDTTGYEEVAARTMKEGEGIKGVVTLLYRVIFGKDGGYGSDFEGRQENEVVGVREVKGRQELEMAVAGFLKEGE